MPTQLTDAPAEAEFRAAALAELRKGSNPFTTKVAAVGTATGSIHTHVRVHAEQQFEDLLKIVQLYRRGSTETRIYPVVGDPGTGKTHLLYVLRDELRQHAIRTGEETLFVVVEHLSPGMDPIDYLRWQISRYMLSNKGDGERILRVIAGRLTSHLLAQSLRHLSPPQQIGLIPPVGFWQRVRMWFGSEHLAQRRIESVAKLIEICDQAPEPATLQKACENAGVSPKRALAVVTEHINRTESKNVTDWFRKELFTRLARYSLLNDREPFDEFQKGETDPPAFVKEGGNISRCLLDCWLELLATLRTPVVVVFDQLEDYFYGNSQEAELANRKDFIKAITSFIDKVSSVCVLAFAARTVWTELINDATEYARERLTQDISLAGKASQKVIAMPSRIAPHVVLDLIRSRLQSSFPELNFTGLNPSFPFSDDDLKELADQQSIRECLRILADRFNNVVHPIEPDLTEVAARLRVRLETLWNDQVTAAKQQHGENPPTDTTFIPEFQGALKGWLQYLHTTDQTGSGKWAKVEVVTKPERQSYGYLTVVRTEAASLPGIGIAAWLGERRPKYNNLVKNLEYFSDNPCPIKTLILLRADGEEALDGMCAEVFTRAKKSKRDVRVVPFNVDFFHTLMSFASWHQAALQEVESVQKTGVDGMAVFREVLANKSNILLVWIDEWRQPQLAKGA
jgi:hypothetical protein